MAEKIYVPKCSVKTRETSFGDVLRFNFHAKTFVEWMRENKEYLNEAGYISIDILPRKEEGQYGESHNAVLDTWKPDPSKAKSAASKPAAKPAPKGKATPKADPLDDQSGVDEEIPF
jgi:hypothetical protein